MSGRRESPPCKHRRIEPVHVRAGNLAHRHVSPRSCGTDQVLALPLRTNDPYSCLSATTAMQSMAPCKSAPNQPPPQGTARSVVQYPHLVGSPQVVHLYPSKQRLHCVSVPRKSLASPAVPSDLSASTAHKLQMAISSISAASDDRRRHRSLP